MQTFLPYSDFAKTAQALDKRRLGKQRVEAAQILKALADPQYGWQHHPAVNMWRGHANCLKRYLQAILIEWIRRGCENNMVFPVVRGKVVVPHWLGNARFHASHRSNLLRKDPVWYGQFHWSEPDDLPYVWPGRRYD